MKLVAYENSNSLAYVFSPLVLEPQVLKDSGRKLGNPTNLDEARLLSNATNRKNANDFAASVMSTIMSYKQSGLTLQSIADKLNALGVKTVRGGAWYPSTVTNILKRAAYNKQGVQLTKKLSCKKPQAE
jgi:3-deoxy-D-arabino-heptulosonate 7-phosphate (DAHP) synthase